MKGQASLLWFRAFWQPGTSQQISKEDEGRARDEKKKTEKKLGRFPPFSLFDPRSRKTVFAFSH